MLSINIGAVAEGQYGPSNPWPASSLQRQVSANYGQPHGTATTAERRGLFRAYATGTVVAVRAGHSAACVGAAVVTVDVYKNGASILSAPISLGSGVAAFASLAGTIASAGYAAGDHFEVVVTATVGGGTLGQGLFVDLVVRENPQ